jgi:hypothetical protein
MSIQGGPTREEQRRDPSAGNRCAIDLIDSQLFRAWFSKEFSEPAIAGSHPHPALQAPLLEAA